LVGPYLIGVMKAQGLESHVAIASMSIFMIVSGLLVLCIGHAPPSARSTPEEAKQQHRGIVKAAGP
jgi:hypothetical protein